ATARDPRGVEQPPARLVKILERPAAQRSVSEQKELRTYYRTQVASEGKALSAELARLRTELEAMDARTPSAMVMEEMAKPRDTFILERGQYDKPGDKVEPGVPASLPPLSSIEIENDDEDEDNAPNRLALARWLVTPGHPLVARVIVNRYWQMFFGTGLVKT